MTTCIGLDPGKTGGFAILCDRGHEAQVYPLPEEPGEILVLLRDSDCVAGMSGVRVWCEKPVLIPGNGVKAQFSVGRYSGLIEGLTAALGLPLYWVAPSTWRPRMVGAGKDKEAARMLAIQHYPHLAHQLRFKNSHGLAESLLIAEWGMAYGKVPSDG